MLVLGRKEGQTVTVRVPTEAGIVTVKVMIVEACRHGGGVRLGFEAPREVSIVRTEKDRERTNG